MSKFLIELPEKEEIGDLVELMADFVDAKYRLITTLETDDERLARSVASLTGQILTPEDGQAINWSKILKKPSEMTNAHIYPSKLFSEETTIAGVPVVISNEMPAGTVAMVKDGAGVVGTFGDPMEDPQIESGARRCVMCGKPAAKRSTICGNAACKKARQKRWDAEWKERQAANLNGEAEFTPVPTDLSGEEDQPTAAEIPFSPWSKFSLLSAKTRTPLATMEYHPLLVQIQEGSLAEGTLFQAESSGKFYEVRQGKLQAAVTPEGVPGAAEMIQAV